MNPEHRAGTGEVSPGCEQLGANCFLLGLGEGRGVGTGKDGNQSIHRAGAGPDGHPPEASVLVTGVTGQKGAEILISGRGPREEQTLD